MKFSVPKTLIGAVAPMLLSNWFFGIGVIEYPIGRQQKLLSAFLTIVNFMVYIWLQIMTRGSELVKLDGSKIAADSYRINSYLSTIFIATSLCLGKIRDKVLRDTLHNLNVINDKLKLLGISNDYGFLFKSQIIQLSIAFVWISILMILGLQYVGHYFPSEISRTCFLMTSYYYFAFAFVVDLTSNISIRYFGNRFQRLNSLLAQSDSTAKSETKVNQFTFGYFFLMNEIYRSNLHTIKIANQRWLLQVIRESRKIHRDLCNSVLKLNKAFDIQVLFSIALSLGLIVSLLYTSYYTAIKKTSLNSTFVEILMPKMTVLMLAVTYATKIFLIVGACEAASSEANRTGGLISKLLNTETCDEDIRDEINIFSLQLIQNPLNFTALGLTLNYSLIRGIIGAVTTYLVIMIQMQTSYEPAEV